MGEVWTQWEGQVVNGVYPLRRFLNASDHSAVFLTESGTEGFFNAAIKLVPAEAGSAEVQLWQWKTATTFTHPHLMRLLDSGQCEIEGRRLLFVIMEYAEETLSQVLPYRALQSDEVRELLVPTLDALAFLHGEGWVQGQVKPSNFLVVNDHLKLALDTIRPVGVAREKALQLTSYDPPETERGETTVAADIWGLGVTLVEALTQYPPTWPHGRSEPPEFPTNLPASLAETIQRCLSTNPAERPTVAELQLQMRPASAAQQAAPAAGTGFADQPRTNVEPTTAGAAAARPDAISAPSPTLRANPPRGDEIFRAGDAMSAPLTTYSPYSDEPERRSLVVPAIAAAIVVVIAIWGGSRLFHGHSKTAAAPQADADQQGTGVPSAAPRQHSATGPSIAAQQSPPPDQQPMTTTSGAGHEAAPAANGSAAVVHEEVPKISPSARQTIHGHVRVAVRVSVDPSGKVVHDRLENASSSKYFNRMASEAARKWKFAAADNGGTREWLLHFEFGREGTSVHATRARS